MASVYEICRILVNPDDFPASNAHGNLGCKLHATDQSSGETAVQPDAQVEVPRGLVGESRDRLWADVETLTPHVNGGVR